jgi:hypothetical protein
MGHIPLNVLCSSVLFQRAYIPLKLAKEQVARVVNDMVAMKDRFTDIVIELDQNYQIIERETTTTFQDYIRSIKDEMGAKIAALSQVWRIV